MEVSFHKKHFCCPSNGCVDKVVGDYYLGYEDEVHFFQYRTLAAIHFIHDKGLSQIIKSIFGIKFVDDVRLKKIILLLLKCR